MPKRVIGLMGVIHVLLVTYSILVVLFFLVARPEPKAFVTFTSLFKSYFPLLFLFPMVWSTVSAYYLTKPAPPRNAARLAVLSWVLITIILGTGDIALTVHAAHGATEVDLTP